MHPEIYTKVAERNIVSALCPLWARLHALWEKIWSL
jgi:hypothetical protein